MLEIDDVQLEVFLLNGQLLGELQFVYLTFSDTDGSERLV